MLPYSRCCWTFVGARGPHLRILAPTDHAAAECDWNNNDNDDSNRIDDSNRNDDNNNDDNNDDDNWNDDNNNGDDDNDKNDDGTTTKY